MQRKELNEKQNKTQQIRYAWKNAWENVEDTCLHLPEAAVWAKLWKCSLTMWSSLVWMDGTARMWSRELLPDDFSLTFMHLFIEFKDILTIEWSSRCSCSDVPACRQIDVPVSLGNRWGSLPCQNIKTYLLSILERRIRFHLVCYSKLYIFTCYLVISSERLYYTQIKMKQRQEFNTSPRWLMDVFGRIFHHHN